jgi:hypothetical protein
MFTHNVLPDGHISGRVVNPADDEPGRVSLSHWGMFEEPREFRYVGMGVWVDQHNQPFDSKTSPEQISALANPTSYNSGLLPQ